MKLSNILRGVLAVAFTLNLSNGMAQQLAKPTLEQLIPGGDQYCRTQGIYGLQWWGDVCMKPDVDEVVAIDPRTGKETPVTTREAVNKALQAAGLKTVSTLTGAVYPTAGQPEMQLNRPGLYVRLNWQTGAVTQRKEFPREAANVDYHAASNRVAYTLRNNLFVDGLAVTNEPEGIECGKTVHRNEFGISKGTFWSPKGNLLAFYRMNESMVTPYPLVDITQRIGLVERVRYPMAGMLSHEVKVGVYNPATRRTFYLNAGNPKNRYFTNIAWAPDEQSLYLVEVNRDQNHARLCQYSAETGELMQVLIEETHPKYVEPQHPIVFLPWDDKQFIYQSQHSGFNHLYLCRLADEAPTASAAVTWAEGGNGYEPVQADDVDPEFSRPGVPEFHAASGIEDVRQLTEGQWLVQQLLGFNAKKREVVIASTEVSPLQSNIYKVSVKTGKRTLVGDAAYSAAGVHSARLSASGDYIIDQYTTLDVPRRIDLASTGQSKAKVVNLLNAPNPFAGLEMPRIEMGTIKAADGVTDLHYRLCLPADFDPAKKYPAIVYVYGGPHAQMINHSYMAAARGWDLYMPSKGYIMFSIDNRGSDNRGLEFENCTFRRLGIEEGKDQVKGVEFLKSLPYVDGNRIGVHGWSFGGHMTTALMLRYPEIFKAGVAGGPVIDWAYYEVMYGERYMDTPQTNPQGYEETNLKNLAGNLKGRLLIIHDDHDDTCVPQHTLSFMKACVEARTYPDLFIYPNHKHNVMGRDRVHLHEKITRYFEDHLGF